MNDRQIAALKKILEMHSKAMACHCECLGMQSENFWAISSDRAVCYGVEQFHEVLEKWGLIDKDGRCLL